MSKADKLSLEEFSRLMKEGYRVIDLRTTAKFSEGFIPGSINLEMNETFPLNAQHFIFKDQALLFITEIGSETKHFNELTQLKYNNIAGYLEGGFQTWINYKKPIDVVISMPPEEIALDIKFGDMAYLDLRPKEDFRDNHLEHSLNAFVQDLIDHYEDIEDKKPICIFCEDGNLSMALISYLKTHKKHNIYHASGGFLAMKTCPEIKFIRKKN